jgi:general secretion pathway protein G
MRIGKHAKVASGRGFSLIEVLVALAIVASILTIAAPKYFTAVERAKEAVLRENLFIMRDAIDKFRADQGQYPNVLADLVTKKYLRAIPPDPFTDSPNSWIIVPPANASSGAVQDVKSSAPNQARDGSWYKDW